MTRVEFMKGRPYKMPQDGKVPCPRHNWRLIHCESDDWDGYECAGCEARFTERCSFEEEFS